MAINGNSLSQSMIPMFKCENYHFWSIKMKILFKSQELWELVDQGYSDADIDVVRLRKNKKKDSKALFIIQQAMHDTIFSRIAEAKTATEAWKTLKTEFQGSARVIAVKVQILTHDFKNLSMRDEETIHDYISRASGIVSEMRALGEVVNDQKIVCKILRSLTPKFDSAVGAIEEA